MACDEYTNKYINKRFQNKLMGDSLDLVPLDLSLFNNLIEAIGINIVATVSFQFGEQF